MVNYKMSIGRFVSACAVLGLAAVTGFAGELSEKALKAKRATEVKNGMNVPLGRSRERKIPLSKATSAWGYYGVPPESPDGKRLCYAVYPEAIDLARKERYPVYPAELWVCNMDGTGHRMLFKGRNSVHNGFGQSWVDNRRIVFANEGATYVISADTGKIDFGPFKGFFPAHFAMDGKVLMANTKADSANATCGW